MSSSFDAHHIPFTLLEAGELQLLNKHLEITYFHPGDEILTAGEESEGLFIIFKGRVREQDPIEEEDDASAHTFIHYTDHDFFGAWAVLNGKAIHTFIAEEETICHLLPKEPLQKILASNAAFRDYVSRDVTLRTQVLESHGDDDLDDFTLAQVHDSCMREALVFEADTSLREVTRVMQEKKVGSCIIHKEGEYGMVTGTDLLKAVVLDEKPLDSGIHQFARFNLISIAPTDYLFNALTLMAQYNIQRVVVMDGKALCGIIAMTDVLSYFSSHSHMVGLKIARANTIDELREAAHGLNELIRTLVARGVRVKFAMQLIAAMNERILARLFEMLVPDRLHQHVCLVVMGSEGRAEQIVKTDQDNALVIREGLEWPEMHEVMQTFTKTLISFGFPRCPGNIMVSNPEWIMTRSEWSQKLHGWVNKCDGDSLMNLAIAMDAKPVAGNLSIYRGVRAEFAKSMSSNEVFFSHFARAVFAFNTPLTFFGGVKDNKDHTLDVKKGGIFPIVHGIRVLAIQHAFRCNNTFERIEKLQEAGALQPKMATDLAQAVSFLMQVRLQQQVAAMDEASEPDEDHREVNKIHLDKLSRMEKDLLREALHVVKEFKSHISLRYHLNK